MKEEAKDEDKKYKENKYCYFNPNHYSSTCYGDYHYHNDVNEKVINFVVDFIAATADV